MSPNLAYALRDVREALDRLELSVSDTEPAPVSIVLFRSDGGKIHRGARIEGIAGLMTYEADNFDRMQYRVLPDLSKVSDETDLCRRCFGPLNQPDEET